MTPYSCCPSSFCLKDEIRFASNGNLTCWGDLVVSEIADSQNMKSVYSYLQNTLPWPNSSHYACVKIECVGQHGTLSN